MLTDRQNFPTMNELYRKYFPADGFPARSTIECRLMNDDMLVEIECVAEV